MSDCFVYIRQDATQSYLEVLFYSIGAFNELQECSSFSLLFSAIFLLPIVYTPNLLSRNFGGMYKCMRSNQTMLY